MPTHRPSGSPRARRVRTVRTAPVSRWLAMTALVVLAGVACTGQGGTDPSADEEPALTTWPLTGIAFDGDPVDRAAFLVKVSNSPEARPQTGLERADVVYEELTEGGVTRFMAVFHSDLPEVVGPIRSARPVDTQILSGFDTPGFAYSGARAEVRALLADTPAAAITEGAPGFFRDDGTYASNPVAPHDLFIRVADGFDAVTERGAAPLSDLGWRFDDQAPDDAPSETEGGAIEIAMSDAFQSAWTYDPETGLYRREQNDAPTLVTGDGRIGADNVVVLEVRHYVGESGYPETDVVGSGDAIVLRDGRRYRASWEKPTATSPLRILTEDGSEVFPLKPGRSWIHLPERLPEAPTDPHS
jgi:hypothetical protein